MKEKNKSSELAPPAGAQGGCIIGARAFTRPRRAERLWMSCHVLLKRLEQIWGAILNFPSSQKRLFQFVPAAQPGKLWQQKVPAGTCWQFALERTPARHLQVCRRDRVGSVRALPGSCRFI